MGEIDGESQDKLQLAELILANLNLASKTFADAMSSWQVKLKEFITPSKF